MTSEQTFASHSGSEIDAARVRELALRLTSWNSETGTTGEVTFANRLYELQR